MNIQDILSCFQGVKQTKESKWQCRCPNHDDKQASLTISIGDTGKVVLHCHAGCNTPDVVWAAGLTMADLCVGSIQTTGGWKPPGGDGRCDTLCNAPVIKPHIVAEYNYTDESETLLFQCLRMEPKSFRQRRPDGQGGWIWNLNEVRRVPYRLPEVIEAVALGKQVLIVEGEKDVENARTLGFTATCCPCGAGKWLPEYSDYLEGAHVVIICDNDKPGRDHGRMVAESLQGKAASVKVIEKLPGVPEKGDFSDWINT